VRRIEPTPTLVMVQAGRAKAIRIAQRATALSYAGWLCSNGGHGPVTRLSVTYALPDPVRSRLAGAPHSSLRTV
jgi:hypothetical protein